MPSEHLFEITWTLRELFRKYGRPWKRVTYRVDVKDDGSFSYVANFEY